MGGVRGRAAASVLAAAFLVVVAGCDGAALLGLLQSILVVAVPAFAPSSTDNTFNAPQSVAISCDTPGASIRYTLDGVTVPSAGVGTLYTAPVSVSTTQTLMATAYKTGMADSAVATATYTIVTGVTPVAWWASTAANAPDRTEFVAVAVDGAGNTYAAGSLGWSGSFDFGGTGSVTGAYSGTNAVLVKFNSLGVAQWARSLVTAPNSSKFNAVAISPVTGAIYVAGYIVGAGDFDFGNGHSVRGDAAGSFQPVVATYDASGTVQEARTMVSCYYGTFSAVAVDGSGNVFASGEITGASTYDFGAGVAAAGTYAGGNAVLVKYGPTLAPQWARSVVGAPAVSEFRAVAVDPSGNVYAAGRLGNEGSFDFGSGVTVAGGYTSGDNGVILRYSPSGTPQWARSTMSGSGLSNFHAVAADAWGNVYAAGRIGGAGVFGSGATVAGSDGAVVVKYAVSGSAQWARKMSSAGLSAYFAAVVDSSNAVMVAGWIGIDPTYDFGNGVTAAGINHASGNGFNAVLARFASTGDALWARAVSTGPNDSYFSAVAVNAADDIAVGGSLYGSIQFGFGNGVYATGPVATSNSVAMKYH
jgi:hypothetical protein